MPKARTAARVRPIWRAANALWAEIEPLLPPRKTHSLGGHNSFRLRTECQWNALRRRDSAPRPRRTASFSGVCAKETSCVPDRRHSWRASAPRHIVMTMSLATSWP